MLDRARADRVSNMIENVPIHTAAGQICGVKCLRARRNDDAMRRGGGEADLMPVARSFGEGIVMAMPAESMAHLLTAEELERVDIPGKSTELVRGRLLVREPPSTRHGSVAARLTYLLADHIYRRRLGVVAQDSGFKIESNPDTVRAPDVAFVGLGKADRIPARGYADFAPDLVAEVVSPNDRPGEVLAKVAQWLDAGTTLVWVIDPVRSQARVYRNDGDLTIIAADGTLDGEAVLPGFTCALADVFRQG
jgi:Uma2 family endonuclease